MTLSIGTVVMEARARRGWTQAELGRRLNHSTKMVSAMETGERRVQPDLLPRLARLVDDPDTYAACMRHATGGIGPLDLDGPNTDLTPATAIQWLMQECGEAIRAAQEARVLLTRKPRNQWTPEEAAQVARYRHHLREAFQAAWTNLAVACEVSGASMGAEFEEHSRECIAKGYDRPDKTKDRPVQAGRRKPFKGSVSHASA